MVTRPACSGSHCALTHRSSAAAGARWFVRWQGVETALPQLRALDVEVRRQKSDPAPLATLRTWVTPP